MVSVNGFSGVTGTVNRNYLRKSGLKAPGLLIRKLVDAQTLAAVQLGGWNLGAGNEAIRES